MQTEHTIIAKKAKKVHKNLESVATEMLTKPLNFKLHKDSTGNIKRLEIRFK